MDREVEASGHSLFPNALIDQGSGFSQKTKKNSASTEAEPPYWRCWWEPGTGMGTRWSAFRNQTSLDGSFSFTAFELPAVKTFNQHPAVIDWPTKELKYPFLADFDLVPVDFSKISVFLGSD